MKTQKIEQTVTKQHLKTFKPFAFIQTVSPVNAVIQIIHENQQDDKGRSKGIMRNLDFVQQGSGECGRLNCYPKYSRLNGATEPVPLGLAAPMEGKENPCISQLYKVIKQVSPGQSRKPARASEKDGLIRRCPHMT